METVVLPALGIFAARDMTFMLDRPLDNATFTEPTLSQMTETALNLLLNKNSPNGFFLMVEGSRIDHAEHANDVAAAYGEAQEFDNTFKLIIDFAMGRNDTLVLLTADHETGGLSLGSSGIYEYYPDKILAIKKSIRTIASELLTVQPSDVISLFENYTGLYNLTQSEQQSILDALSNSLQLEQVITQIISENTLIGWTSSVHTGVDVNLYGYGPSVYEFCGNNDNTDLAKKIERIFGWDVAAITRTLVDFDTSGRNFSTSASLYDKNDDHHFPH